MPKNVFFGQEARKSLQKGIDIVANAAGVTLGASGKGVIISSGYGHMPIVTKDGVTVVRSIFLEDEVENTGAMMIRYAAEKTLETCGDGTTTSTVLAQSMITKGLDAIETGANPQEIKKGIEKATDKIWEVLKEISIPVSDNSMLRSVATISANNDIEIGEKIAEAYSKIGNDGLLTIEKSHTVETYITITEGAEMPRGYANDKFVTDTAKMQVVYENPLIFVADYEIKTVKELEPLLISVSQEHNFTTTPLIIIAKGFEGEPYNTMIVNKVKNGAKFCLIEAPNMYQKEALVDISTLTGAKLISDDIGKKVEHATLSDLGTCKKIVVSKTSTLILEGAGDKSELELLKIQISNQIDDTDNAQLKEILQKRLARLSGSIGVIYVGGTTELEQKERYDRVDDANRAVKSAIEEGVVPGGGVALIRCAAKLSEVEVTGDEAIGVDIVRSACMVPLMTMIDNSGGDYEPVLQMVCYGTGNSGYNLKTKEYCDMVESNIIDPTKVVRCALQNAASVAAQIITSGASLIEMRPKNNQ